MHDQCYTLPWTLKKGNVSYFCPLHVVVTSEAHYYLACLGSTERFVQKAMASANAEFSRE